MQPNLTTAHDLDLTKTHLAKSDTPLTSVAWTTTKVLKVLSLKSGLAVQYHWGLLYDLWFL